MGSQIFSPNPLGKIWVYIWLILSIVAFTALGYWIGVSKFDNPEVINSYKRLRTTLSNVKRQQKGQPVKHTKDDDKAA